MSNYFITWTIDDDEAGTPQQAARNALARMHQATVGDPAAANTFTVLDRQADRVHHVDLGSPDSALNLEYSHWPRPDGLKMTLDQATAAADHDGRLTLRVRIDIEQYMYGYAMFLSGSGGEDHFDQMHHQALDFGVPHDCSQQIIEVDDTDFLVEYSTVISDFLTQP